MFSEQLKETTMSAHQELEKRLVGHIKKIETAADYIRLLEIMYGFYKPLEQKIGEYTTDSVRGRSADNILEDIRHFAAGTADAPAVCTNLPVITDYPSALGAMYVTEGSTLGGVFITSMIAKRLNISTDKGFTFFNSYGDRTKDMWSEFKSVLNENASDENAERITGAALGTFQTFNEWIIANETTLRSQGQ